jgi:N-methylhydantoinase A
MVGALHSVLTEQGLDPRDFVLVAFGGAGPPHISDLMTDASIPRGLVPNFPGQFSALGFIMADARVDRHRTVQLNSRFFDRERAAATMSALVKECTADLAVQGHTDIVVARSVEMRYLGQNHELEIPTNVEAFADDDVKRLLDAFHELHEARFGFRLADHIEIVNFLVTGIAKTGRLGFPEVAAAKVQVRPTSRRPVWFADGWIDTPVYARADLLQGHTVSGPALIEESASVTVLDPGKTMAVDRYGNLLLSNAA